jgi:hypothetical protein
MQRTWSRTQNRDDFDPEAIVNSTVGGQTIIIMDSNKNLNTEYYSELAAFQNNQSQFNEDLAQFVLDANDDPNGEADNLESSDIERQDDEDNSEETQLIHSSQETLFQMILTFLWGIRKSIHFMFIFGGFLPIIKSLPTYIEVDLGSDN